MDLSTVTDIQQLKAMAYDELQRLEIAKQNVQLINQRILELEKDAQQEVAKPKKATSSTPSTS